MTVSEAFIPGEGEQEGGGGGLFGIKPTPKLIGILVAVLGVAASVGLFIYLLQPEWTKQEELKGKIQTKKDEIAKLKSGIAQKEEAQRTLDREKQLQAEVNTLFGDSKTLDTLLLDINKWVKKDGAKLVGFNPADQDEIARALFVEDPKTKQKQGLGSLANFDVLSVSLDLVGTFAQTQSVLGKIERLEPLVMVGQFESVADLQAEDTKIKVEVDPQGKVKRVTEPILRTKLNLAVIVPKSQEELAAARAAAAAAEAAAKQQKK